MAVASLLLDLHSSTLATTVALGLLILTFFFIVTKFVGCEKLKLARSNDGRSPPEIPGFPLIGNLLQLKEKRPHKTFTKWAEIYGPIYGIRLGYSSLAVLNSVEIGKEKRHRCHRDTLVGNLLKQLHDHVKNYSTEAVNFRKIFQSELFCLALKEALGRNVESVHVEELQANLSRDEIFKVLVLDMMEGAIEVDWRDFFPYLRWIPNKSSETKIHRLYFRRQAVMKALIKEQNSFRRGLSLLRNSKCLWIRKSCRGELVSASILECNAVFHETLRKYSPVPVVPIRLIHEDTQLGGYHIPAGTEIAINIYGCNRDKKQWKEPESWKPERFLSDKNDSGDLYKTMAFGTATMAM